MKDFFPFISVAICLANCFCRSYPQDVPEICQGIRSKCGSADNTCTKDGDFRTVIISGFMGDILFYGILFGKIRSRKLNTLIEKKMCQGITPVLPQFPQPSPETYIWFKRSYTWLPITRDTRKQLGLQPDWVTIWAIPRRTHHMNYSEYSRKCGRPNQKSSQNPTMWGHVGLPFKREYWIHGIYNGTTHLWMVNGSSSRWQWAHDPMIPWSHDPMRGWLQRFQDRCGHHRFPLWRQNAGPLGRRNCNGGTNYPGNCRRASDDKLIIHGIYGVPPFSGKHFLSFS